MKIGIEVELHSTAIDLDFLLINKGFSLVNWKPLYEGCDIGVRLSREYYSSTIEYNFTPFELSEKSLTDVKEFLEAQIKEYGLMVSSNGPQFVGTHIHIFDEDRLNTRIKPLLNNVLGFLSNNLDGLEKSSINRLLFAHQLWGNYSWKDNHSWRNFLNSEGKSIGIYDNTREKTKYNPIIFSKTNRDTGKPPSLEIRIIPNEFVFSGKLFKLLSEVKKKRFTNAATAPIDFWKALLNVHRGKSITQTTTTISEQMLQLAEELRSSKYIATGNYGYNTITLANTISTFDGIWAVNTGDEVESLDDNSPF